ncbi:MAG: TIGR03013 family XrtA/PEP-CTERM system glycosyltransferase [Planctomycetota bacterium]|jgi:sugar transferase (PEP-CTERM system associated)
MARIFNITFSLRKVALVIFETFVLTTVILPISDFGGFLKVFSGEVVTLNITFGEVETITLSGFSLLGFLALRAIFIVLITQVCFFVNDLYSWKITSNPDKTYIRLLESVSYALILIALAYYCLQGLDRFFMSPEGEYVLMIRIHPLKAVICMVFIYTVAYYYRIAFHWTHFTWKLSDRLLIVGINSMTDLIVQELRDREDPGFEIVGYAVQDPTEHHPDRRILGGFEEIFAISKKYNINRIITSYSEHDVALPINELLNCRIKGIHVEEATLFYEKITKKIALEKLHPTYLIFSEGFNQYKFHWIFKRLLDIAVSGLGLILASPIILATAILIKLDSRGPVFHKQKRVGREGRIFTLVKFRSMHVDAEKKTGPVWAQKNDSRVTRIGRIIRKVRIDEIPQMWNVLRNEMSFVGPRPERPYFVEELKQEIPYYTQRLVVKPGITGWAQINYMYGSSREDALEKLQFDLYYIKNMSIFLDIIILLRTFKVVIRRQGAV